MNMHQGITLPPTPSDADPADGMDGAMQDFPLTLDRFLRHAAKWHPHAEVVTAIGDGAVARIGYDALAARAAGITATLADLGIRAGDRVATLAWNSQAHVEAWYAIMGMGAVCHTLNPRLTAPQLADMADQSSARLLIASADLLPLASRIAAAAPAIERILVIDGEITELAAVPAVPLDPVDGDVDAAPWGDFPETAPCGLCFTSGTTGAPKGVTYTHRSSFLHALRLLQADVMAIRRATRCWWWCRCSMPTPGACRSRCPRRAGGWCCRDGGTTARASRG